MSYIANASTSSLGIDKKQGPSALPASAFPKAIVPTVKVVYEACHSVIINIDTGSVHFLPMTHTASVGSTLTDDDAAGTRGDGNKFVKVASYATGSVGGSVIGAGSAQIIELPTPAQSWSGSDGAGTGNVTFVYRGGL